MMVGAVADEGGCYQYTFLDKVQPLPISGDLSGVQHLFFRPIYSTLHQEISLCH